MASSIPDSKDQTLYDVALSFAGEDRQYVEQVAEQLRDRHIRFFYDKYEEVSLWGIDLYTHLQDVYRRRARYTVMFISKYYARKIWSNHERQAAQSRALEENREYILPARFDDTEVPGLNPTIGYVDLEGLDPSNFAKLIIEKISGSERATETEQARQSNKELKRVAIDVVDNVRGKLQKYQLENNAAIHSDLGNSSMTEEERSAAWNRRNVEMSRITTELMSSYDAECKVTTLLLRDELLYRLPTISRDKHVDFMYEHPTNPLGVGEVADDLEKLARMLSDDA